MIYIKLPCRAFRANQILVLRMLLFSRLPLRHPVCEPAAADVPALRQRTDRTDEPLELGHTAEIAHSEISRVDRHVLLSGSRRVFDIQSSCAPLLDPHDGLLLRVHVNQGQALVAPVTPLCPRNTSRDPSAPFAQAFSSRAPQL